MNIGIIGAGFMGFMHARIIKELACANLVGIAGKTAERARLLSGELGIPHYASPEELMNDRDIDVVDICAPTGAHAELACAAMTAGKHVIVEFPACRDRKELDELVSVSRATGRICAVAYYARFQSQYKYFFELAASDKIGKISSLFISRKSSSVFAGDDIVNDLLSQDIDCMVRLLGKSESFACANDRQNACTLLFRYPDCVATIEGATNMPKAYPFTTRHIVTGEKGSLELEWSFVDSPVYSLKYTTDKGTENIAAADYDPYRFELEQILTGIAHNDTTEFDIASVYDAAALAFECRAKMQ